MKRPTELVVVKWRDCFSSGETWKRADSPPDKAIIVHSVGWIIPDYKKGYLVMTDTWFGKGKELHFGTLTYIPEDMVFDCTFIQGV